MSENNQFEFLWKQIQGVMQEMISPITYEMYISKLVPVDIEETKIVLKTDTEFFANYIGTKLAALHLRFVRGGQEQRFRVRGGAVGRQKPCGEFQPPVHIRRFGTGQNPPFAVHRQLYQSA